jgi:hypothetical protein
MNDPRLITAEPFEPGPVRAQRVNTNERHRISPYWIGWICG